jgi:hypothetical protein
MWARYRRWKHAAMPLLVAVVLLMMRRWPAGSTPWSVGTAIAVVLGLAYVIEEVVWNLQGGGRPCAHCGRRVPMRSFRVRNTCPGCGAQL